MNKFSNAEPGGIQEGDPAHFYYLLMPGRERLPRGARCSILESRLFLFFFFFSCFVASQLGEGLVACVVVRGSLNLHPWSVSLDS